MSAIPDFLHRPPVRKQIKADLVENEEAYRPLMASWLIEIAILLDWHKYGKQHGKRCRDSIIENSDFVEITSLQVEVDEDGNTWHVPDLDTKVRLSYAASERLMKERLAVLGKQAINDDLSLLTNIDMLGKTLGMSNAEKALLCFTTLLVEFSSFRSAIAGASQKMTTQLAVQLLSRILGYPEDEIRRGLSNESILVSGGLLRFEKSDVDLEHKIELLDGLGSVLLQPHACEDSLIGKFLRKAGNPSLSLQDYPHLTHDIKLIDSYLGNALLETESGTNILLYGTPGTGKTEFVKALAAHLGADLYEITFADADGDPITGQGRLRAYNLCQRLLAGRKNALLMFDEIEDVFPDMDSGFLTLFGMGEGKSTKSSSKAWVNRALELNNTPALWITNSIHIDPAYLRRFDYSIRFPIPPLHVRTEIARHHLGQFQPSDEWLAQIASNEEMNPGQYERAAKVARLGGKGDNEVARALVKQALDRSATLLEQKRMPARNVLHTGYDRRFINAGMDIDRLIVGLRKKPRGTFCFYGPAGTGKSELARHISDELGMPIIVRRASDLLSKWVGESEKNIARMFADARQQEAVLVLDEADSFLADRRDAQQSWEVTQVNELLTQMEAFEGIFMCTTNLMEKLDQASLRRFAFKVKFDYLNPDQRWGMFRNEFVRLGGVAETAADWEKQVRDLDKLTPGDFAVAARQFDVLDTPVAAGELYRRLQEECRVKGGSTGKIGFV